MMSIYGYICVYSKSMTPFDFDRHKDILKVIDSIAETCRTFIGRYFALASVSSF